MFRQPYFPVRRTHLSTRRAHTVSRQVQLREGAVVLQRIREGDCSFVADAQVSTQAERLRESQESRVLHTSIMPVKCSHDKSPPTAAFDVPCTLFQVESWKRA